jgi:hypothetical protein
MYKIYCSCYDSAISTLTDRLESRPAFADWVYKTRLSLGEGEGNLFSYLIMPVQRVPRYSLLLDALLKYTPQTHPDYENLRMALQKVTDVAIHVNHGVSEEEHRMKVVEVQKRFIFNYVGLRTKSIVVPHRRYIREGILLLENTLASGGKLYCYLFNDVFITATMISGKPGLRHFQDLQDIIPLHTAWVIEATVNDQQFIWKTADSCCFGLLSPQGCFIFRCSSEEIRKNWTEAICDAISGCLRTRDNYLRQRSLQLPVWINGYWKFRPLENDSLSLQMAKHVLICNDPPPYLVQVPKTPPQIERRSTFVDKLFGVKSSPRPRNSSVTSPRATSPRSASNLSCANPHRDRSVSDKS